MCCSVTFVHATKDAQACMHDGGRLPIYQTTAMPAVCRKNPCCFYLFIVLLATGRRLLSYVCFGPCRCMISRHPGRPAVTPTAQLHFTAKQIKCTRLCSYAMCKRRRVQVCVCAICRAATRTHATAHSRSSVIFTSRARFVPERSTAQACRYLFGLSQSEDMESSMTSRHV